VQDAFYVWDPNLTIAQGSAYGLGGFQTIYRDGGGYSITPGGGSYSNGNYNIKSGEAFFVRAIGSPGQVLFTEQSKTIDVTSVSRSTSSVPTIKLNYALANAGNPVLLDGIAVQIDSSFSNTIDAKDILKIGNSTSENIAINRNGIKLSVERRRKSVSDTIFLQMGLLRRQLYQFTIEGIHCNQLGFSAKIFDKQFNTATPISLDSLATFNFAVTQDAASYQPDRFYLVLTQTSTRVLPKLLISANMQDENAVEIKWDEQNESNVPSYVVEKSEEGIQFKTVHSNMPNQCRLEGVMYSFIDEEWKTNQAFYRVKEILADGLVRYSNLVTLSKSNKNTEVNFVITPNPVVNKTLNLQLKEGLTSGKYLYEVHANDGRVVLRSAFIIDNLTRELKLTLPENCVTGNYILSIVDSCGKRISLPFQSIN
jgi:hypothetical protein